MTHAESFTFLPTPPQPLLILQAAEADTLHGGASLQPA
jgi:hypothetical protein